MLEFAREQYLWLFALVALFFVVFFFARRWKKARVTYGFIWERVAKRTRPPTWKRLLRLILTLLISGAMLSSAALYAAGLGPAKEVQPAPLLIFIVIDNSPSMRARAGSDSSRRDLAQRHAREWTRANTGIEHSRTLTIHFERGLPVGGRWEYWQAKAIEPYGPTPTDFVRPDLDALARLIQSAGVPPDIPVLPKPQPLLVWFGDDPPKFERGTPPARLAQLASADRWRTIAGMPAIVETFGSDSVNHALRDAVFTAAPAGRDTLGTIDGKLLTIGGRRTIFFKKVPIFDAQSQQALEGPLDVPVSNAPLRYVLGWGQPGDPLPEDDSVVAAFNAGGISTVLICRPKGEEPNPLLREGLELLLGKRTFDERAISTGSPVEADLVVLDRVNVEVKAKILLCFGALPPSLGEVLPVREAKAGLFDALEKLEWLGFEIPNLQLLAGREAFPLKPGHKLTPLATHVEAGVLVAASQGERDVLYIGYSPTQSNFLFVPEGPTLLQRWLNAVQGRERMIVPPFCRMDQSVELKLDSPEKLRVKLIKGWENVIGATEYEVMPSPDSRARLGPFEQPGEYEVTQQGRALGRISVYWVDETEQALPYTELPPLDLSRLAPVREHSWVDWFPEILLWIALGGLLLEWLLWLLGWTD